MPKAARKAVRLELAHYNEIDPYAADWLESLSAIKESEARDEA